VQEREEGRKFARALALFAINVINNCAKAAKWL